MPLESPEFTPLPSMDEIRASIAAQEEHLRDLSSYMWYILPVAARFGERAFEVAARALSESGIATTSAELAALASELRTPEGQITYAGRRAFHIGSNLTSYKR
jgi:hypothetical protein